MSTDGKPVKAMIGQVLSSVTVATRAHAEVTKAKVFMKPVKTDSYSQPPWLSNDPVERCTQLRIPERYWAATLDDFTPENLAWWDHSKSEWVDVQSLEPLAEKPSNLFIVGKNGAGKSHLAASLAIRFGFQWRSVAEIFRFADRRMVDGLAPTSAFKDLRDIPMLVIEDIGQINAKTFAHKKMIFKEAFVDREACGESIKPTIVTSRVSIDQVESYDADIASRLSGFNIIMVKFRDIHGGDRRQAGPEKPMFRRPG